MITLYKVVLHGDRDNRGPADCHVLRKEGWVPVELPPPGIGVVSGQEENGNDTIVYLVDGAN